MLKRFRVILEPNESGGYTVTVPLLPGCISEGETEEEALSNIKEPIELYLEPVEDGLLSYEDQIFSKTIKDAAFPSKNSMSWSR